MKRFFESVGRDGRHLGFEPRGEQWNQGIVHDVCRDLDLVHVVDPLQDRPAYGTPHYFRIHGNGDVAEPKGYYHEYTDSELAQLREKCTARKTYCLFNNVTMREDAERFRAWTGL